MAYDIEFLENKIKSLEEEILYLKAQIKVLQDDNSLVDERIQKIIIKYLTTVSTYENKKRAKKT